MNMIPEKISTRFRIGIIGPGSICVTYGNALKASDTVSLACICGRDTEKGRKTAERFQVPYYTDQEQMYRNEALDGVLICTPTYTHEEMVRRALARRVPVMCEKPLALDAETARRLVAEAADADVPFMVMQVVRFWPEYRALARLIRSGQLGRIKNVYMSRLSSHPAEGFMISISMSLIFYTVFSVRRKRFTPLGIGRRTDALTTFPPACAFPRVFRQWPRALWI